MIVQSSDTGTEMIRTLLTSQEYCWNIYVWHIGYAKRFDLVVLPDHGLSEVEICLFGPPGQLGNIRNRSILLNEQSHCGLSLTGFKTSFHSSS
ncbi:hypothetical protein SAMN05216564_11411 [Halopenitus persicus]|uniref:Uncharacterized protein n=1 Tax=Halopenitus persicus TaxID=1048396 RepID=A0A1H3NNJ9_9EURY|nr:hypothetical protein SAMN05216564_11411 [Halopenitus persicus]